MMARSLNLSVEMTMALYSVLNEPRTPWTFIDFVPSRHRTRFMDMCWELKRVKQDFHIIDVKEKYDEMRIYIDTANEEAQNIIDAYWKGVKYYD